MKLKNIALSMFLVLALMFAMPITLAAVTAPAEITIGGPSQEASNPLHNDGPKVVETSGSILFTNTDLVGHKIKLSSIALIDTKYTLNTNLKFTSDKSAIENLLEGNENLLVVEFDPTQIIIDPATTSSPTITKSVALNTMIPSSLDAVNSNLEETAFDVANVKYEILDAAGVSLVPPQFVTVKVKMQRENNLEITDTDAEINNKGKENIDDGDEIKKIKPSDVIDITVETQNNYDNDADVDIENTDLIMKCTDSNAIDIDDENLDVGDISPDDKQTDTFNVNVEDDAPDGSVGCQIKVQATDQNGAFMGQALDFDINVERESHDIQIKMPIITNPQTITCDESSLQMSVNFMNLGKSDENEVAVEVTSADLAYQERHSNIELNEDDAETEIFDISLEKLTGKTPITFTIRTFYDNVKSSDTETLLVDNACTSATPSNGEGSTSGPATPKPVAGKGTIILEEGVLTTNVNKFNSIAVQVTNNDKMPIDFEVSLSDITDFAVPSSPKVVRLSPGQTSTIFLNFKTKPEIEAGTYTGTVTLKSGGQVAETQLFNVEVASSQEEQSKGSSPDTTKIFWIIGDIILIIVAIFFIRLIFTGGKKKGDKKMADYEASAKRR